MKPTTTWCDYCYRDRVCVVCLLADCCWKQVLTSIDRLYRAPVYTRRPCLARQKLSLCCCRSVPAF